VLRFPTLAFAEDITPIKPIRLVSFWVFSANTKTHKFETKAENENPMTKIRN
jgi:hypothetical protein